MPKCRDTREPKAAAYCANCADELADKRARPGSLCAKCQAKQR